MSDTEQSLKEQIHDKLVVDEPNEDALVDALEDAIEIVRGSGPLRLKDGIAELKPKDQIFAFLLGKYAATRVSDGDVLMSASRKELYEHFDRKLVKEMCEHGWIRHWEGQVQIRPRFYKHTADELAARYADRTLSPDTNQLDPDV
jgi:hypothetical protein